MSIISINVFPYLILMIVILIFLSIALIPIMIHKPDQWFLIHKSIMGIALIAGLIGLIILGLMNFLLIHVIVVSITIVLLIIISFGGFVASEKKKQDIRKGHIWLGRVLLFIVLIYIIVVAILLIL